MELPYRLHELGARALAKLRRKPDALTQSRNLDHVRALEDYSRAMRHEVLGPYLRRLRLDAGLTTAEAARLVGWHQSQLSRIETGSGVMNASEVHLLLATYGVDNSDVNRFITFMLRPTEDHDKGPADPSLGLPTVQALGFRTVTAPAQLGEQYTAPSEPIAPEDLHLLAQQSASTINHTLARLFVQLGPPPESVGRDPSPVTSDGGGAQQ